MILHIEAWIWYPQIPTNEVAWVMYIDQHKMYGEITYPLTKVKPHKFGSV